MDTAAETGPKSHVSARHEQRRKAGCGWRDQVPFDRHAEWRPPPDRRDPVAILIDQGKTRISDLLGVRNARMKTDPFAFLRGAAAVMAADLGAMPATGLRVQSCGDCHLANFGAYDSPEGIPVFDINDFDETLPAPFEWDVKRLAASLAVAGRVAQLPEPDCRRLARLAVRDYRRHMARLAPMAPLEVWSAHIDLAGAIADVDSHKIRRSSRKASRRHPGKRQGSFQPSRAACRHLAHQGTAASRASSEPA